MNQKKISRIRRGKKTRIKIRTMGKASLIVTKTPKHIYAQIIDASGQKVLASVSTVQKSVREGLKYTGNIDAAIKVGSEIAKKAVASGIDEIVFDRNGFPFHGRIKALADAAREAGLKF